MALPVQTVQYRCPPPVVEAVKRLEEAFPTLDENVFLHNNVMPDGHNLSHNGARVDFTKTHASYLGDIPSYLGYEIILRATALGYTESLTIYVYDPSPVDGKVNREAAKRALWHLIAQDSYVALVSIRITKDAAGQTGFVFQN